MTRRHDEAESEALVLRTLQALGLPTGAEELSKLRKGDKDKVLVAALLRKRTSVGNQWFAERLAMGHTSALSRMVGEFRKSGANLKLLEKLE